MLLVEGFLGGCRQYIELHACMILLRMSLLNAMEGVSARELIRIRVDVHVQLGLIDLVVWLLHLL